MRHTHSRAQRYGGHTKHTFYCVCGKQVSGNGGKQHFKLDGHRRITREQWRAITNDEAQKEKPLDPPLDPRGIVLGHCEHGVNLDREFCPEGCRV
jgi:hypothetical protein